MENPINAPFSRRAFVAGLALTPLAIGGLSGCSASGGSGSSAASKNGLTMLTASGDYSNFEEALKAAHSDVELSFESYKGSNTTAYIQVQMEAEQCPDIVINTFPNSDDLQKANLLDLSGEDLVSNIRMKLLDDVTVDGAVYLVPSTVSFFGPYYNKTLFEKHGWSVPQSQKELDELVPQIKAAGVKLAEVTSQFPGSSFAFLWDILAPTFTSTLEGIEWMEKFRNGEAKATGTLEPYMETFQHWIDLGMLDIDPDLKQDTEAVARFKEGNTAFLVTISNQSFTQEEDGSGDEYRIMPWLSEDGSNNIIVTNVSRYYGLNKNLEDDSDKLEKGLEVMDFIGTAEGQESLTTNTNTISPLKNAAVEDGDPLHDVSVMVDEGKSMNMIYSGWESYVADMGAAVFSMLKGEINSTQLLAKFDELQAAVVAAGKAEEFGEAEEDLELDQVAQLVGACFAQAVDADCALISLGAFHGHGKENSNGVNGKIYKGIGMTSDVICTFNPLGWSNPINTMQLDGKTIKEWADEGFFVDDDDEAFEYVLVTKDGAELEDGETYTVALTTESDDRTKDNALTATEVVGQDALEAYLKDLGKINSSTIAWK